MARLQILELPSTETEMCPFALVIDGVTQQEARDCAPWWQDVARLIGARAAIVRPGVIDIPRTLTADATDDESYAREGTNHVKVSAGEIRFPWMTTVLSNAKPDLDRALNDAVRRAVRRRFDDPGQSARVGR